MAFINCAKGVTSRPAPIMLEILPIILLKISQNFHLLFFCA